MHSLSWPEAAKIWTKIVIKRSSVVAVASLVVWQSGCGGGTLKQPPAKANISISPDSAMAGSQDLTVTITATRDIAFRTGPRNIVVWTENGADTALIAGFVTSSEIRVVVPAALLSLPVQAQVRVEIFANIRDDSPQATSSSIPFQVKSSPPPTSANISISPDTATAGSPDLTLTILALNNFQFHNGIWHSLVLWRQGGVDTQLQATFVSSSEVTAILSATLLANAVNASVRVEIWDNVEGTVVTTSSSVPFTVTSP